MRKKPNLASRVERCSQLLIQSPASYRGHWRDLKPDARELRLELGCGKGRFTAETAEQHPEVLYIALERVADAMIIAMERCQAKGLTNVFFIDGDAALLREYFAPGEVDLLYINFCDPWPSNRHARRRLTHESFLTLYRGVLRDQGEIHFKTDNRDLFEFSLFQFPKAGYALSQVTRDLHAQGIQGVMTDYEEKFHNLGTPINRCVGSKLHLDPEPEFHPIVGPDDTRRSNGPEQTEPTAQD
jgi:tRNA (guanine-N7-)-methyltransferase